MLKELKRLSKGQKTTLPAWNIADWALTWVKIGMYNDEIAWLERLYSLEDTRQ